jgi:hypothetical protein
MPYSPKPQEHPHDPPKDPDRFGRMQIEYISQHWPELFREIEEIENAD